MEVMQANTLDDIFFLPLSQQALNELEHIQVIIQNVPYDENGRDTWLPSWGPIFTSNKFYSLIYILLETHPVYRVIWKSSCTPNQILHLDGFDGG